MIYPDEEEYERVGRVKYPQIEREGIGVVETKVRRKNGEIMDVILSSAPIDPSDMKKGVTFTLLDITERKSMEKEVKASEKKLRKVVDSLPHMIYSKDRDGTYLFVNKVLADALGMEPEQIRGKRLSELCADPREAEKFLRDDREVIDTGRSIFIPEEKFTTEDGRVFRLQTTKLPLELDDGRRVSLGISYDISGK